MGNKYTVERTYYSSFPSIEFYSKELQMNFTLNKDYLFLSFYERVYFQFVFKENSENNIWKFSEPFFSHYQFTFGQEPKTFCFYNSKILII